MCPYSGAPINYYYQLALAILFRLSLHERQSGDICLLFLVQWFTVSLDRWNVIMPYMGHLCQRGHGLLVVLAGVVSTGSPDRWNVIMLYLG